MLSTHRGEPPMDHWSRRQVVQGVGVAGLALLAGCGRLPGHAPPPAVPRLGWLTGRGADDNTAALAWFHAALGELGYVEGQNLLVEYRWADGQPERLPGLAGELVALPVDVLITLGAGATSVARAATGAIPIVKAQGAGDLVQEGLAASYAHPGGNVTGINELGPQLAVKQLELITVVARGPARVAVLAAPADARAPALQEAAPALGVQLHWFGVRSIDEIAAAFAAATQEQGDGLVVLGSALTNANYPASLELSSRLRLPAIPGRRAVEEAGGLM